MFLFSHLGLLLGLCPPEGQKRKIEFNYYYMHVMFGSSAYIYGSIIVLSLKENNKRSEKAVKKASYMSLNPSSKYEALISIIEDILLEPFATFTGHLDILVGVTGFQLNIRMSGFRQFIGTEPNISQHSL